MSAYKIFKNYFSKEKLQKYYHSDIKQKATVGIDRINRDTFENKLILNTSIINNKVHKGTYRFTHYKEKLILKGRNKKPRIISIPTIRDKVTLKALNELLFDVFKTDINNVIVQTIINDIKNHIKQGRYTYFIKLDIDNFYPSISHNKLLTKIRRKIRKKELIDLIISALQTKTVPHSKAEIESPTSGVPQGLSISNILASIYLIDVDAKYRLRSDCIYFRYVDDIFILTTPNNSEQLISNIKNDFNELNLNLNMDKYESGDISDGFNYLGYQFTGELLSVRTPSIEKLQNSILKTITQFKYSKNSSPNQLEWSLNLRITGCIYKDKKYGWLFFFSQIDDLKLLFHLDWFVQKMLKRYHIDTSNISIKKFIRAYKEITNNLSRTNYIPDLTSYNTDMQRHVLSEVFQLPGVDGLRDDQVDYHFSRMIFKSLRDLEQDIQRFS